MSQPISVVMAVYNGLQFLQVQLASVLSQLESQDELIVVNDASHDGSRDWLATVSDHRVHVYTNNSNLGVLKSFERGLLFARHAIVFLCDQDDVWLPGKRAAFVAEFERDPRILVVVSDAELIDAHGVVTAPSFMAMRGGFHGGVWSTLVRNRYLGCAMALHRELLNIALPIPRSVPMHDMWFGILGSAIGKVGYIKTPLIQYRRHAGNVSPGRSQPWQKMVRWRLTLLGLLLGRLFFLIFNRLKRFS